MKRLSLGRFFKYFFTLVSLFLIFQAGAAAPAHAADSGEISGKVTKDGTTPAEGIAGLWVNASPISSGFGGMVQTQADGTYTITGLWPGPYWVNVSTDGTNYVSEYYNNVLTWNEATAVDVVAGQTTPNIDFGLATGGSISGKVTKDGTTDPISNLQVNAESTSDGLGNYAYAWTQADGTYTITGLAAGQFKVSVFTYGTDYLSEYYDNVLSWNEATAVDVVAGETMPGINFGLATGGSITGTVTQDGTAVGIAGLQVQATYFNSNEWAGSAQTLADGTYTITGLATGQYKVRGSTSGTDYLPEYYNNVLTWNEATAVDVVAGQTTPNIDFGLATSGSITGTVTKDGTTPAEGIAGLWVDASPISSGFGGGVHTQADGTYTITGLATGSFKVQVYTYGTDYLPEYYNNVLTWNEATAVDVVAGQTTPNIDFGLAVGSKITGTVTKDGTTPAEGIAGLWVNASPISSGFGGGAQTQADGTYTITGLAPGQYRVNVSTFGTNYVSEYYNNVLILNEATAVDVVAGQTTPNIDFGLAVGSNITGTVTKDGTTPAEGIAGLWVFAYPISSGFGGGAQTQADGTYTITAGLAPGQYRVNVSTSGTYYVPEYYNNVLTWNEATAVDVVAGQTTPNIDFGLATGGSISGKVTEDGTTDPISLLQVNAESTSGGGLGNYAYAWTQADGTYTFTGLAAGQFKVSVSPYGTNYVSEYYNNVLTWNEATAVDVVAGQTTPNIDFGLSMAVTPMVENEHAADGNYYTLLDITINSFTDSLQDGISAITVTGPGGNVIATKPDFTYDPAFRSFTVRLPGQPALGDYTFTVTGNGMPVTAADVQFINRNLPVPDKNTFSYTPGANPTFTWPALGYTECPLYYRLIINNMAGTRVYASNRVLGMLSHTVPAGTLLMGQTYQFEVRASDSSNEVQTQNSSRSGYVTFMVQEPGVIAINPEPAAMNATAPWTLTGPNSYSRTGMGDTTLNDLHSGDYTLTWGDVSGWTKPSPASSTPTPLAAGGTITFTGTYTLIPQTGTVVINPEPADMNATAPWTLTGPNSYSRTGMGDLTLNNLAVGNYTITWGDVSGWNKPSPASETTALTNGGTTTFSGSYVHQTIPVIQVTPVSLNFGYVPVGSTKDLFLTVRNTGGGTLTGNATTTAPFSIVSGGSYSIGADQSRVVTIKYQPTSPGTHTGAVVLTGGDGATVPVTGKTEKPLGLPWLLLLLGN